MLCCTLGADWNIQLEAREGDPKEGRGRRRESGKAVGSLLGGV